MLGGFGGVRTQVTATARSVEVRHLCLEATFNGPLVPGTGGSVTLDGVIPEHHLPDLNGAPARVRGTFRNDSLLFTFEFRNRFDEWLHVEPEFIAVRDKTPSWTGGSCPA